VSEISSDVVESGEREDVMELGAFSMIADPDGNTILVDQHL
jgi:hypothetical protein